MEEQSKAITQTQSTTLELIGKRSEVLLKRASDRGVDDPIPQTEIFKSLDRGELLTIKHHQLAGGEDMLMRTIADFYAELFEAYGDIDQSAISAIEKVTKKTIKKYPYLTPEEIALFCDKAIEGAYGKPYGKLTRPTVLEWLKIFVSDRLEEGARLTQAEANQYKERGEIVSSEQASEELNKMLKSINYKRI